MKIDVPNPCTIDASQLKPVSSGCYCDSCKKVVIDYSLMTDAEVIAHIDKNGIGCGIFREDQLNRVLVQRNPAKSFKALYLLLIAFLFTRHPAATAQSIPDTIQVPIDSSKCNKAPGDMDENIIVAYGGSVKRMGTGHIARIKHYRGYGFFWRKIRVVLFRVRIKQ